MINDYIQCMTQPYVYLLYWRKPDKFYCGKRTKNGCDPIDLFNPMVKDSYWTSQLANGDGESVPEYRNKYGKPDEIYVETCSDAKEATALEYEFLTLFRTNNKNLFLNRSNGGKTATNWNDPVVKERHKKATRISNQGKYTLEQIEWLYGMLGDTRDVAEALDYSINAIGKRLRYSSDNYKKCMKDARNPRIAKEGPPEKYHFAQLEWLYGILGSVCLVAEALGVTQSSVSKQLRKYSSNYREANKNNA